jgi:hypothetical protein
MSHSNFTYAQHMGSALIGNIIVRLEEVWDFPYDSIT